MIVEVGIIATFVILFDLILKAYFFPMSKQLGPYVGLIITNCIVMGRAEAFAIQNKPGVAIVDGIANGVGYGVVLAIIGFVRELAGTGGVMGFTILETVKDGGWYTPNQIMILAPGAFIMLGIVIAVFNKIKGPEAEEN